MKKIISVILIIIFIFTSCDFSDKVIETEVISAPDELIVIDFSNRDTKDYISIMVDEEFKRIVEEKSEGKITINLHSDKSLNIGMDTMDNNSNTDIEIERISSAELANSYKIYNILMLPYLFRSSEHMNRVLENDLLDSFIDIDDCPNFTSLAWFGTGELWFYTSKEINTVEDIKGLNIKGVNNIIIKEIIEIFDANYIEADDTEVFEKLANGEIDGTYSSLSTYVKEEYYKYVNYYNKSICVRNPELYIIDQEFFSSLSAVDQSILKSSAKEASLLQAKLVAEDEKIQKEIISQKNIIIKNISDEQLSEFKDAVLPIYEKYAGYGEVGKILDIIISIE